MKSSSIFCENVEFKRRATFSAFLAGSWKLTLSLNRDHLDCQKTVFILEPMIMILGERCCRKIAPDSTVPAASASLRPEGPSSVQSWMSRLKMVDRSLEIRHLRHDGFGCQVSLYSRCFFLMQLSCSQRMLDRLGAGPLRELLGISAQLRCCAIPFFLRRNNLMQRFSHRRALCVLL